MAEDNEKPAAGAGTAVWYFLGATFLFTSSTFIRPNGEQSLPIIVGSLVLGFIVFIAGVVVFSRELKAKRRD